MAGVVFHDYQPEFGTIQLSMAADNPMWARRENLRGLLSYPFEQLGVHKVWTATPHDNEAAIRVNLHIGFKKEATLAHHFGLKRHAIICRMLKPDYNRIFGD
jgi:RimJ/RimL family protein N-acetyltransferase